MKVEKIVLSLFPVIFLIIVFGVWQKITQKDYLVALSDPYSQREVLLGAANKSGQRPSAFKTTLAQGLGTTAYPNESIKVNSLTTKDGHRLTSEDIGDFIVFHINPGASNDEIVACRGISSTTTAFTDCTRGYTFYNDSTNPDNVKAHSPGETIIISDDDLWLRTQYPAIDDNETILGVWRFSTTTATKVKLFFSTSTDDAYIWYDTSSGQIGYSATNTEYTFVGGGTSFTPITPLTLVGGELKLATSTNAFKLTSNLLDLNLNNSLTLNSSGLAVATTTDFVWTGQHTFTNSTTTGNVIIGTSSFSAPTNTLTVIGNSYVEGNIKFTGNATSTGGTVDATQFCISGSNCVRTSFTDVYFGTTSRTTAQGSGTINITGVGFKPSLVQVIAVEANQENFSEGWGDGTNNWGITHGQAASNYSNVFRSSQSINTQYTSTDVDYWSGTVGSFIEDGFSISLTANGSPTNNLSIYYIAYK